MKGLERKLSVQQLPFRFYGADYKSRAGKLAFLPVPASELVEIVGLPSVVGLCQPIVAFTSAISLNTNEATSARAFAAGRGIAHQPGVLSPTYFVPSTPAENLMH